MKLQDKINKLEEIAETYDMALSNITGTITACLGEDELSDWQARSILRTILATSAYYAEMAKTELKELNDE
jgi:hypothetical protein